MAINKEELKEIIIKELFLEDITPAEIEDDAPLFGEGLGLDSLDAVELVVIIQKHFKIEIKDMDEGRVAFNSINSLADFIGEKTGIMKQNAPGGNHRNRLSECFRVVPGRKYEQPVFRKTQCRCAERLFLNSHQ